jgi:hypothetical protein
MVKIIQSNPYGKLTEEKLRQFEDALGTTLPEDYRKFLLEHNGPFIVDSFFDGKEIDFSTFSNDPFFGITDLCERNLDSERLGNEGYLPDGCLAIIGDGCGNYACIGLQGHNRGKIYYFDHEVNPHGVISDMNLLADTFADFWTGLEEDVENPRL